MGYCTHYLVGVDVGLMAQPTAIAILEQESLHEGGHDISCTAMRLRHLERLEADAGFPELATRVHEHLVALADKEQGDATDVLIDITGTGTAVVDLLKQRDIDPIPVIITHGVGDGKIDSGTWRLAKSQMVTNLQVLFQTDKLKVAKELPLVSTFVEELQNFKPKQQTLRPEDGEAWREGQFDDLVFAAGIVAWWAANNMPTPKSWHDERDRLIEKYNREWDRMVR